MRTSSMISDEEFESFCVERLDKLKLTCCICENRGWSRNDMFQNIKNMMIPSCKNEEHAVCYSCILKLPISNSNVVQCSFPYSPCSGNFNLCKFEIHRGFLTKCSECFKFSHNFYPEGECYCDNCKRKSCGRCDEIICNCYNKPQNNLEKGYSRFFSEKNSLGESFPIRRNFITKDMINEKINQMNEDYPWFHSICPTCEVSIYKSSACNDMHHCGPSRICNFCLHRSFPWEDGICNEHWKSCPRWDHEISSFLCREGECVNDGQECNLKSHKNGISHLHKIRYENAVRCLQQDIRSNILK